MAHKHDVDPNNLLITVGMNIIITVVEVLGGIFSGSLALLSDALHNFNDITSALVSYIALRLGEKDNTISRTYGYKRAEILAAFLNSLALILIALFLFKEAYSRYLGGMVEIRTGLMLLVAAIGLAANLIAVVFLKKDAEHNINVRSAYTHLLGDTFSSVAVIAGGVCMRYFAWFWLDPLLTVIIALYVLKEGAVIFIESLGVLLDSTPSGIDLLMVQKDIESIPGVKNIHHVHIRQVSEHDIHLEGHINLQEDQAVSKTCVINGRIEEVLRNKYNIGHSTIQFEIDGCSGVGLIKNRGVA